MIEGLKFEGLKSGVIEELGEKAGKRLIVSAKRMVNTCIGRLKQSLSKKLSDLRKEKQQREEVFQPSGGSRKIVSYNYIKKENDGAVTGSPFPQNLRPHRRNRPHRKTAPPQTYIPTAEDLEERNPVIISKQNIEIGQAGKSLLRRGAKFCPTPTKPINELKHYENFIRWRENIRWKYHFEKDKNPDDPQNDFEKKPWYQKTDRKAPVAKDCPELRKKIKDNILTEERSFLKQVKEEYPNRDLRIRFEDKGHRFVIADGTLEDSLIETDLHNKAFFK